ncbi:hypothetical protein QYM36_008661, partial [Artemia franciscana]
QRRRESHFLPSRPAPLPPANRQTPYPVVTPSYPMAGVPYPTGGYYPYPVLKKDDNAVKVMPLTNTSFSKRIDEMNEDIESLLVEKFKSRNFSLQVAESPLTDKLGSTAKRLDGKSLGRLLLSEIIKYGLDITKYVGQGYDKAASMSSLVNGADGDIKRSYQLAYYFHCVSHATNLSCSKIVSVPILRNAQDVVR